MSGEAVTVTQDQFSELERLVNMVGVGSLMVDIPALKALLAARHRQSPAPTAGDELVEPWGCQVGEALNGLMTDCPDHVRPVLNLAATRIQSDAAIIAGLRERVERLERALEPFDDALGEDDEFPDSTPLRLHWGRTTVLMQLVDLRIARRARAALKEASDAAE